MSEREPSPQQSSGLEPLTWQEFSEAMAESKDGKEVWYAKLIDRYHNLFEMLRFLRKEDPSSRSVARTDLLRDKLHKQLEKLGKALGKGKDEVMTDVIAREGNLGEYGLPEYGVLSADQLNDPDIFFELPGFSLSDLNKGNFVRIHSAEDILEGAHASRKLREKAKELEAFRRKASDRTQKQDQPVEDATKEQTFTWKMTIPGYGTVEPRRLKPGEVGILFGSSFTVDILQEPVDIIPPGYEERLRRAVRAAQTLRQSGVDAGFYIMTVGVYHDTTTVFGIVVPSETIDRVADILRKNPSSYGIRLETMDAHKVEMEYQKRFQATLQLIESTCIDLDPSLLDSIAQDILGKAMTSKIKKSISRIVKRKIPSGTEVVDHMAQQLLDYFDLFPPEQRPHAIELVREDMSRVESDIEEYKKRFLGVHRLFFNTRHPK